MMNMLFTTGLIAGIAEPNMQLFQGCFVREYQKGVSGNCLIVTESEDDAEYDHCSWILIKMLGAPQNFEPFCQVLR